MANYYFDEPIPMDVDDDIPVVKPTISKPNYRKRTIPASLKMKVWNYYIGEEIGKTKCMCCREREIIQGHFEAGHVVSERVGGATILENLRPICSLCNKSMGAKNMLEFMEEYGYRKPRNWNGRRSTSAKKEVIIIE
jgi:hypothetical protein